MKVIRFTFVFLAKSNFLYFLNKSIKLLVTFLL